jgi:hypothetical protein
MNTDILMTINKLCLNKDDQFKFNFWTNMYKFAEKELLKLQDKHNAEFLQRQTNTNQDIPQELEKKPTEMENDDAIQEIGECTESDGDGQGV